MDRESRVEQTPNGKASSEHETTAQKSHIKGLAESKYELYENSKIDNANEEREAREARNNQLDEIEREIK